MRKDIKDLPHTSSVLSLLRTDSKNYYFVVWFKIILISASFDSHFPTHSQILPHRLCFWKIAFRQFQDAIRTAKKKILWEYYFKIRIDSVHRNEALCGCWVEQGDTLVKNDTASGAISFSGSKRNIWLDLAPKNTNPAKETTWVGSRQPSKQTPPALLASGTICSRSYLVSELWVVRWSPRAEDTYCHITGHDTRKVEEMRCCSVRWYTYPVNVILWTLRIVWL